ncbi:hypothetical protein ACPXCO_37195 [Streptomyces cyaneofuscatus]|uniref:hypothetical protein n=1 Tax=Streptomyces cyaneofuscatus TaxID=66883 RepID=UPI003CF5EA46
MTTAVTRPLTVTARIPRPDQEPTTTLTTALGNVTFDPTPGRWTRTAHRPSTGQHFEAPMSHEHVPADINRFTSNGVWDSIEGSPCGRTITLTRTDTTNTEMTLAFSRD